MRLFITCSNTQTRVARMLFRIKAGGIEPADLPVVEHRDVVLLFNPHARARLLRSQYARGRLLVAPYARVCHVGVHLLVHVAIVDIGSVLVITPVECPKRLIVAVSICRPSRR